MVGVALLAMTLAAATARARTIEVGAGESLAAALEASRDGDEVIVDGGVHPGPLAIEHSIRLAGGDGATIDGGGEGTILRVLAPDVRIENLVVRSSGDSLEAESSGIAIEAPRAHVESVRIEDALFGIYLRKADGTVLRGNVVIGKPLPLPRRGDGIRVWYSDDVRIEGNRVERGRDVVLWYSERLDLRRNLVRGGRYGLHFMYCDDARIEENRLLENSVGSFLMYSRNLRLARNLIAGNRGPSGYGVGLKDMDDAVLEENVIVDNRIGVYADNSPRELDATTRYAGNVFAHNDFGLSLQPSTRRNRFSRNAFVENLEQVSIAGGGELSGNEWAAGGVGNHWSDYAGYDADGDGIGDVPYVAERLFERLADRRPSLRLLLFGPAVQAIDFAARAFPIVRPRPKLEDDAPRVEPAWPSGVPSLGRERARWPLGLVGGGLLVVAATLGSCGVPRTGPERGGAPRPAAASPMLVVRGLSKRFGRVAAVDGLDLEVARGESVALCGANGAGKTTALRCVLGVVSFDGQVVVDGVDVARHPRSARARIGFVSQELALYDDLTVRESFRLIARIRGAADVDAARIEALGLAAHVAKRVGELSGGLKQRLALGLALVADPPLLVLDEPTANLDPAGRESFLALLDELRGRGKTILFTAHRQDEVLRLADRMVILADGRKRAEGSPRALAGALAGALVLRLRPAIDSIDAAVDALRARGFEPLRNGASIAVPVSPTEKGRPIAALAVAGIAVEDFELEWTGER